MLTLEPGEAERLAAGAPNLQRRFGMPIDPRPLRRPASSEPACRAVVAVRLHAPGAAQALLRRLRVRAMVGGLLDEPELIAGAARDAGLDPGLVAVWVDREDAAEALAADIAAARAPAAAARALDHKLGGPPYERRYTAPSYELRRGADATAFAIPGLNPVEVYETAIANLAPELVRAPKPERVEEVLAWAGEPLATAELALLMGLELVAVRAQCAAVARELPAGRESYWTLGEETRAGFLGLADALAER